MKTNSQQGKIEAYWYIACCSKELKSKPLGLIILQQPLVIFRTSNNQVVALEDRCIHRNAPLSQGRICQEQLECPYHGWRYGSDGKVAEIPAFLENSKIPEHLCLKRYHCLEQDGYVWVCLANIPVSQLPLKFPYLNERGWTSFRMKTSFSAAVETCLENFLDCPHASYVHRFWFRSPSTKAVKAVVTSLADGAVAEYFEEPRETSLVWWLLTKKKSHMKHTDRFIAPSTTRVDYSFDDGSHYIITSACTSINSTTTEVYTVISFKVNYFGWLIRLFFEPLSRLIIKQDVAILKLQQANIDRFGKANYQFMETDLLALYIRKWRQAIAEESQPPPAGIKRNIVLRI